MQDRIDPELNIVPRAKWGALPPKFTEPLPLPSYRLGFVPTNTERCESKSECIKAMRTIQKYFMEEKGMPDLPYSFLIGGDLRVYEGRGWGVIIRRRDLEDWVDERLVFGYIAPQTANDKKMEQMIQKAYDLMYYGISQNYLMDFDAYDFQDKEAAKNEEKEFKATLYKKAKKECDETLKEEKENAEEKGRQNKNWTEHINEIHYAEAKKPKYSGDKDELKKAIKENKDMVRSVTKKKKIVDEESEWNTEDILGNESDEPSPL